jgi:hypothetical protein
MIEGLPDGLDLLHGFRLLHRWPRATVRLGGR